MRKYQPLVSIALCTYNGQSFLKSQIDSLVSQTYQNIEIIIVDDCSKDETASICQAYKQPHIHFYQNTENLGYTKNFEKAIDFCNGELICLCDQDDVWELHKVETLVSAMKDHVLIYHDSDFVDEKGEKIGNSSMGSRYRMYDGEIALPFLLSNCISGHAIMFSKELIPYILPFDERFYHDWWLAYVAFNLGKVKYIDQILVHYRQHTLSVTDNLGIKPRILPQAKNRIAMNLDWLQHCASFKLNKNPMLINRAYQLFAGIRKGKNRFALFLFLVKYYDLIFYIISKPKSITSKINYARKIAFSKVSHLGN